MTTTDSKTTLSGGYSDLEESLMQMISDLVGIEQYFVSLALKEGAEGTIDTDKTWEISRKAEKAYELIDELYVLIEEKGKG